MREASTTVVGQLATIVVPVATAAQTDLPATRAVQTEHASTTPMMEVAQPAATTPT